ncbi:MAG: hypothetical protein KFKLKKLM_01235 [Flavobacteriales bacterium]|nr:hypothetical protein [Flavobacteriales bacterium]
MITCLFCNNQKYKNTAYEDTVFNNKVFKYVKCTSCGLVYVNPLPNNDDLIKMYPVEYQGELVSTPSGCYDNLFKIIAKSGKFSSILDFGCGGGKFVIEAIIKNYKVTGVEFNPELVKNLKSNFQNADFYTTSDFFNQNKKFDIIFLSNIIEHLINPLETMLMLKQKLNENGIFVIEGPIENNMNLTKLFRKSIFYIRKTIFNKQVTHTPTHVLYSNRKNQEEFFKKIGLTTFYYKIDEINWPFPMSFKECNSLKKMLLFLIASVSVKFGKVIPSWGNVFLYIGKVN